ncbi:hypothetical protein AYL99_01033 [Fonsecaea erecta]|uniref:tRNA(His) guanylyltransferase n=1 Tax=Fonsecaea erecta TaxID=1367422 RepID=A0A179A0E0_9EURO|nr:hypothetical protein AYL99_01033 [Fonsecaea erecta]OAP65061.1 hypothetical protein AYL99_01033 [Fonsecaea erecta]
MANSKYEYVRSFEREEVLLPNTWIVVRIDGRGFHKLSDHYGFRKPNDVRALRVMNAAATHVVAAIPDIVLAYGVSDEFSFVFHRAATLFDRRRDKLVSTVVSAFTAAYALSWDCFFGPRGSDDAGGDEGQVGQGDERERQPRGKEEDSRNATRLSMDMLPTFDGRAVCYPSWANLRDYLSWRQVDYKRISPFSPASYVRDEWFPVAIYTNPIKRPKVMAPPLTFLSPFPPLTGATIDNWCHINNLYNTTFWALVQQGGMTHAAAEESLKGTVAGDKNEILWSRFGINYNNEPEMYRKGSVVFREYMLEVLGGEGSGRRKSKRGEEQEMEAEDDDDDDDDERSGVSKSAMSKTQAEKMRKARKKAKVVTRHVDIIRDEFWNQRPWLRSGKPGRPVLGDEAGNAADAGGG